MRQRKQKVWSFNKSCKTFWRNIFTKTVLTLGSVLEFECDVVEAAVEVLPPLDRHGVGVDVEGLHHGGGVGAGPAHQADLVTRAPQRVSGLAEELKQ